MKRLFGWIHLWLSVPFGIILTLICFSGAMLVFEKEVTEWVCRDLYRVEYTGESPLPIDKIASDVASTLPHEVKITGVTVYPEPGSSYRVGLSRPGRASVFVDPYTGRILGQQERLPFFATMFSLHRWLLDSRPEGDGIFWGKMIVGVSVLMFVFVLLSGLVIWWPRTKKMLKNNLKLTFRKGWHRLWRSLHVAGGFYALLLLLVMALTGLTWSFNWYRAGFYRLFGVELQQGGGHGGAPSQGGGERQRAPGGEPRADEARYAHWQKVYEEVARLQPAHTSITVSDGSATVSANRFGNTRGSDRYAFDPRSGELTEKTLYEDTPASGKMRGWIYSVHVGSFGGLFTRVLWFLASLMGAALPLTGYYLWLKRICRKH